MNMPAVVQGPVKPWAPEPELGEGETLGPLAGALDDGVTLTTALDDAAAEEEVTGVKLAAGVVVDVGTVTVRNPVDEALVLEVRLWAGTEEEVDVGVPAVADEPAPAVMLKYTPESGAASRAAKFKGLFMMPWLLAVAAIAVKAATMVCVFICIMRNAESEERLCKFAFMVKSKEKSSASLGKRNNMCKECWSVMFKVEMRKMW